MFEYFQILWDTRDVTWGGGGGDERCHRCEFYHIPKTVTRFTKRDIDDFLTFFDICLVDPGSIQESPGIIFKYF